jgi:uncharacterized protein YbjT (DUF2867 family)
MIEKHADAAGRIALLAGGSGLIGARLLPLLLASAEYSRVHTLSRRALPLDHPRLANRVVRFDAPLEPQLKGLQCHDAFCCLGTTLRNAGSQDAFRAIDRDLVLSYARFAAASGAQRFIVVSAVGADPASKNFYLRVKGEMEVALEALRFRSLSIMQPSMLLGTRRELRPLELLALPAMLLAAPLLRGRAARWRPIDAGTVGGAMQGAARAGRLGVQRYEFRELRALAASLRPQAPRL